MDRSTLIRNYRSCIQSNMLHKGIHDICEIILKMLTLMFFE